MNPWDQLKQTLVGKRMRLVRCEHSWLFDFGDDLTLNVETLWRLRDRTGIVCTSEDDGHQFGLPAPLDAENVGNELLKGVTIASVEDAEFMPDFTIRLSDGFAVDVIARSAGYESWQTSFGGVTIVGRCD